jgi:hypothetical protein
MKDAPKTEAFRRWFGDSVVRNPDGSPKVVYHGTASAFTVFDYSHYGKTDWGFAGRGFYFMDSREWAEGYAAVAAEAGGSPRVIAAFLRIRSALVVRDYADIPGGPKPGRVPSKDEAGVMQESVRQLGCDGVVVEGRPGNPTEYVVFDPRQIKSIDATKFDPEDPDILHGLRNRFRR